MGHSRMSVLHRPDNVYQKILSEANESTLAAVTTFVKEANPVELVFFQRPYHAC